MSRLDKMCTPENIKQAIRGANEDQRNYMTNNNWKDICLKCRGKGYSTEHVGETSGAADFIGDKRITISNPHIEIRYCSCDRGKQIEQLIESVRDDVIRKFATGDFIRGGEAEKFFESAKAQERKELIEWAKNRMKYEDTGVLDDLITHLNNLK